MILALLAYTYRGDGQWCTIWEIWPKESIHRSYSSDVVLSEVECFSRAFRNKPNQLIWTLAGEIQRGFLTAKTYKSPVGDPSSLFITSLIWPCFMNHSYAIDVPLVISNRLKSGVMIQMANDVHHQHLGHYWRPPRYLAAAPPLGQTWCIWLWCRTPPPPHRRRLKQAGLKLEQRWDPIRGRNDSHVKYGCCTM